MRRRKRRQMLLQSCRKIFSEFQPIADRQSGDLAHIGSHGDLANCVEYSLDTGLIVTAVWDKKIVFWDTRCVDSVGCVRNLLVEAESMSLTGYHLVVAVETSVNTYDLRNLSNTVKESNTDEKIVFWDTRCADSVGCVRNLLVEAESMALSGYHLMVVVGTSVNTYDLRKLSNTVKESNMDEKIVLWDTRCADSVGCVRNLLVETESMSLSGYHLMVVVGTSVNTYDLRNLSNTVKESNMDEKIVLWDICCVDSVGCVRNLLVEAESM